nr:ABC transporter permease [Clostridia bacterium]
MYRYDFLISQLVIRDFKSKYKRSILGVFWSFLNPLLTMTVQFLVFSTFFSSDTQNYPVYLLSGVVCFSFFNECTTICLSSISGNARLITKVYIPKYIFPLARTISSSINLAISLVPLLLASLVLGVAIRPQAILFFYFLICLIIFSLGIGLFLSALMVFFRDIQFLWSVLTQIWMYATPIFYPAEIIPEKYRFIVRFNPLYHFIGNCRTCLINGISPEPMAYIFCLLFAMVSLFIGAYTFKKTQDKFALYL